MLFKDFEVDSKIIIIDYGMYVRHRLVAGKSKAIIVSVVVCTPTERGKGFRLGAE